MNLIVNARDAMHGRGKIDVTTAAVDLDQVQARRMSLEPGRFLTLTVRDTGTGMDARTLERIFEPFFTTKEVGTGTGLGLSTVYGIVSRRGGYVDVCSEIGEGTSFIIYLPQSRPEKQVPGRLEHEEKLASKARQEEGRTVLLVEDDRLVMLTLREYLTRKGYQVLEASDGSEAVQIAREHRQPISLLICDMVLPGMPGAQVAQRVRKIHQETEVIHISAHPAHLLAEAGHLTPGAQILQKPFGEEEFIERVRDALDGTSPESVSPPSR
jgi:CheY-like chemotaxis protein